MTSGIIPFYGADDPEMFAIEREAMDRDGLVIGRLDGLLPPGRVVDVGAGDGFTAEKLTTGDRTVVPLEPDAGMIEPTRPLPWVQGVAQTLPFSTAGLDAAYATWAYFFPAIGHGDAGLAELHRVVRPGGRLLMVDNAGGDEFTALAARDIASDPEWWHRQGFELEIVETAFRFDTLGQARLLLGHFFGETGSRWDKTEIGFRAAIYAGTSKGPGQALPA